MKILVTGGSGFIGSHAVNYYANHMNESIEQVVLFDNLSRASMLNKSIGDPLYNWNYLKQYSNISLINGDVRDFNSIKKATQDVDAIIHTAAQVAVTTSIQDPRTDFEVNALGTFNVLESARVNDVETIIFTSTNKVYGENVNHIPVTERKTRYEFSLPEYSKGVPETFPVDRTSHSPYGCSKLTADMYMQDYAESFGLRTGIFRMSCIYGDRQFGTEDQGWVAWFTIATLLGKPITIFGDGKQVRDVLYVDDLIRAFDLFLKKKSLLHEVFNMGGGPTNTLSLLELVQILQEQTGKTANLSYSNWRPSDQKVYISDIEKAQDKLSWSPLVAPRDGLKKLVDWCSSYFTSS